MAGREYALSTGGSLAGIHGYFTSEYHCGKSDGSEFV